jgi:hypothetical protein
MNSRTKYAKSYAGCCIVCKWWEEWPGTDQRQKPCFRSGECHSVQTRDWFEKLYGDQACVLAELIPSPYRLMDGVEEGKP